MLMKDPQEIIRPKEENYTFCGIISDITSFWWTWKTESTFIFGVNQWHEFVSGGDLDFLFERISFFRRCLFSSAKSSDSWLDVNAD